MPLSLVVRAHIFMFRFVRYHAMKRRFAAVLLLLITSALFAANSPSHTLASSSAERFSTDKQVYAAVVIYNRATNSHNMQVGGPEITATTGGVTLVPGSGFLFQPAGGARLYDTYVAGTSGDVADAILYPTKTD